MGLMEEFSNIIDPRDAKKINYKLLDIIFMSVCSALAGAMGWNDIHDFVTYHKDWFKKYVDLSNGIPSHDTFRRIFMIIEPSKIEHAFAMWAQTLSKPSSEQIAIDGKILRGTGDGNKNIQPLCFVSAWCHKNGIVLGQVASDSKSNEITAIPTLLEMLTIKNCLISIDAAGCQKNIAKQIVKQKGDYLLAVKGNQPTLHTMTQEYMQKIVQDRITADDDSFDKSHGRTVRRRVFTATATPELKELGWEKLNSIIAIETIRKQTASSAVKSEWRYYISSKSEPVNFPKYIRNHWGIENQLHWVLDVNMGDDASRCKERHSSLALSALKRIAINVVKRFDPDTKSVRRKLRHAAWDINHLEEIILKAG
jgi:predicted transposase YbfD/YdcC